MIGKRNEHTRSLAGIDLNMSKSEERKGRKEYEFSPRTREEVKASAGGLCSNPYCLRVTSDGNLRIGQACHIYSASDNGPRGRGGKSKAELKNKSNGIWLCGSHHLLVDPKANALEANVLYEWKEVREASCTAALDNDDVGKMLTIIGVRAVDKLVRKQYREKLPDEKFTLNTERLAAECWEEALKRSPSSKVHSFAVDPMPQHFKRTPIAATLNALGSLKDGDPPPGPYACDTAISESSSPDDESLFTGRALAALSEIVGSWKSELGVSSGRVINHITYALAPLSAESVEWDVALSLHASALFSVGDVDQEDPLIIKVLRTFGPLAWDLNIVRRNGEVIFESSLVFGNYRFERILMPEEYEVAEAHERLLMRLESGAELVGLICPRSGHNLCDANPSLFQSTSFPVSCDELPDGAISDAIWKTRRIKLLLKISAQWRMWFFTAECFDRSLTDSILEEGVNRLQKAQFFPERGRATVDLMNAEKYRLQLICNTSLVKVIKVRGEFCSRGQTKE